MSKKTPHWKANHLLNFQYGDLAVAPRNPTSRRRIEGWDRHGRMDNGFGRTHRSVQAEQAAFVLGRYHFALSDAKSNALCLKDPDRMVDWDTIVEVTHTSSIEEHICPICLHYPIACRIAKCGHVFCLPCILVYLEGQPCRPCCMCPRSMQLKQLKRLRLSPAMKRAPGALVSFALAHRDKGSVCLFAAADAAAGLPAYASPSAVFSQFNLCASETAEAMEAAEALEIRERLEALDGVDTLEADQEREMLIRALSVVEGARQGKPALQDADGESSLQPEGSSSGAPVDAEEFYTYIAADGQPIFLCSLNMHMLLHDAAPEANTPNVNAFAAFHTLARNGIPLRTSLEVKLLQMDAYTQTEETRRRFKHLAHLPLRSEFYVAEVDLSSTVHPETMHHFQDQVDAREHARQRRSDKVRREEEEARRRHEQLVEARRLGAVLPTPAEFPALEVEEGEGIEDPVVLLEMDTPALLMAPDHDEDEDEGEPAPQGSFAAIQREQAKGIGAWGTGGRPKNSFAERLKSGQPGPVSSNAVARRTPTKPQVVTAPAPKPTGAPAPAKKPPAEEEAEVAGPSLFDRLLEGTGGHGGGRRGRKKNTISLTALHAY
eukprot:EG_transcript_4310